MGNPTTRLTIFWQTGNAIHIHLISNYSRQQIVILTNIWWWQKSGKG
jgi:hypothetical protein